MSPGRKKHSKSKTAENENDVSDSNKQRLKDSDLESELDYDLDSKRKNSREGLLLTEIGDIFSSKNPSLRDVLCVLKEIFISQQFLSVKYDEHIKKNMELIATCQALSNENIKLKEEIKEIKETVNRLTNNLIEKKIEIQGVPHNEDENIIEIVMKIANNFNIKVNETDIDDAYRKKHFGNGIKPKPIVVTFTKKKKQGRISVAPETQKYICRRNWIQTKQESNFYQ